MRWIRCATKAIVLNALAQANAFAHGVDALTDLRTWSSRELLGAHLLWAAAFTRDLVAHIVHLVLHRVEDLILACLLGPPSLVRSIPEWRGRSRRRHRLGS